MRGRGVTDVQRNCQLQQGVSKTLAGFKSPLCAHISSSAVCERPSDVVFTSPLHPTPHFHRLSIAVRWSRIYTHINLDQWSPTSGLGTPVSRMACTWGFRVIVDSNDSEFNLWWSIFIYFIDFSLNALHTWTTCLMILSHNSYYFLLLSVVQCTFMFTGKWYNVLTGLKQCVGKQ